MAAMENPRLRAYSVDAQEFPDLANRYEVSSVPLTVVNGKQSVTFVGKYPEDRFVSELQKAAQ
jgi:predicted DsbA family dithiol-disulfide isomerase